MKNSSTFLYLTLFFGLLISSCSDNPGSANDGTLTVQAGENSIFVRNNLNEPVYYFAVESELATRINWAPVAEERNEIKPWETKTISYEEIQVSPEKKELILYYWTAEQDQSGDYLVKGKVVEAKF